MKIDYRLSKKTDLPLLTEIYNQAIRTKACTCDTEELTCEDRLSWLEDHDNEKYPLYTCLVDDEIAGYIYLTPYRKGRQALDRVAEVSYYFDSKFHSKGLGSKSLAFITEEAKKRNIEILIAILLGCNKKSIGLLKKYGFEEWGRMPEFALLNGNLEDHLYLGKKI